MLGAGVFKHLTVSAEPSREVNQRNVSSRLEALNPGQESAIFQLPGKNMCSRNIYKILSKSATALANHVSVVAALKDFLHLGVLGSRREHSVASFKSECHHGCVHVVRAMSGAQCWNVGWSKFQIICLELVGKPPTNQSVSIWKYRNLEFLKNILMWCWTPWRGCFACCQMR